MTRGQPASQDHWGSLELQLAQSKQADYSKPLM